MITVTAGADAAGVYLGVRVARGEPAAIDGGAVDAWVQRSVEAARAGPLDPKRVRAVRDLLKHGRYRATGRGKPAHEFLHRAAVDDRFPRVFGAVDLLNAVSLVHQLPMSLVDLDAAGTDRFVLRRGRAGESYVFNSAGQSIGLEDLLLLATEPDDAPCANPVKDAMRTKLTASSGRLAAVVYAPMDRSSEAEEAARDLSRAFTEAWPDVVVEPGRFSPASDAPGDA